jgi:rhodanese-related sulfurtransferase
MKKFFAILVLAIAATLAFSACAPAADPIVVGENTIILDVRTPAEYNEGHLEGAVNLDVQAPNFLILLGQLPTDGDYIVYCKSGNRSGQATQVMTTKGFTNVTDAGGMQEASAATGLPIVK